MAEQFPFPERYGWQAGSQRDQPWQDDDQDPEDFLRFLRQAQAALESRGAPVSRPMPQETTYDWQTVYRQAQPFHAGTEPEQWNFLDLARTYLEGLRPVDTDMEMDVREPGPSAAASAPRHEWGTVARFLLPALSGQYGPDVKQEAVHLARQLSKRLGPPPEAIRRYLGGLSEPWSRSLPLAGDITQGEESSRAPVDWQRVMGGLLDQFRR